MLLITIVKKSTNITAHERTNPGMTVKKKHPACMAVAHGWKKMIKYKSFPHLDLTHAVCVFFSSQGLKSFNISLLQIY